MTGFPLKSEREIVWSGVVLRENAGPLTPAGSGWGFLSRALLDGLDSASVLSVRAFDSPTMATTLDISRIFRKSASLALESISSITT